MKAGEVAQLPVPQIRQRIDEVHRFLVERFLPHLRREEEANPDYTELSRLTAKLDALGERLIHSYFGPDQLLALQEVLDDVDAIVDPQLAGDLEIDAHAARISGSFRSPFWAARRRS
jgi:hypothetical protein